MHQRVEFARARAVADAGVSLAIVGILGAAPGGVWPQDGRLVAMRIGTETVRISAQDELGLIDVNAASPDILSRLFENLGFASADSVAAAAAIARWRTPPGRAPRMADDLGELAAAPGVPRALMVRAAPFLTTRNGSAAVDPVTAPAPVLRAMPSLPRWLVATLVSTRAAASALPGTLPLLNDPGQQGPPARRFAVIRAEAALPAGGSFIREAEVELHPSGDVAYRVMRWRRGTEMPAERS